MILKEFGFRTSIWTVNKHKTKWNEALRLTINGFKMMEKWNKEIGFSNPKNTNKLKKLKILE